MSAILTDAETQPLLSQRAHEAVYTSNTSIVEHVTGTADDDEDSEIAAKAGSRSVVGTLGLLMIGAVLSLMSKYSHNTDNRQESS